MVTYRLPSYGAFEASVNVQYWYGIARNVSFPGVMMDVDRLTTHAEAKDMDSVKRIAFLRMTGASASGFENAVPEKLFSNPALAANDPAQPQGVSAVKALAIASSQGQRIYTLNAANQASHATILASIQARQEIKDEISNALAAGKEATIHAAEINVNGWTGSGYLIIDPDTGVGAYKIGGGVNGGSLPFQGGAAVYALLEFVNILYYSKIITGLTLVSGPIGVGLRAGLALTVLVAGLSANNPSDHNFVNGIDATQRIQLLTDFAMAASLLFVLSPLLFALIYASILLFITDTILSLTLLTVSKTNVYAMRSIRYARTDHA